ncbi:MAG: N-acetylmuramoyl-L-alanine amidase [Verrucomicrobiota bacterium]|nr:N-acetylmuramoyl-L-alanine amidase [Verrucomicrobiota bacterium]
MVRFRISLTIAFALSLLIGAILDAQTDEEKRAEFLKTRVTASPSPDKSPSPTPKPKKKATPTQEKGASPKPKAKTTETPKPIASPKPSESPTPRPKGEASPHRKTKKSVSPKPKPSETPEASDEKSTTKESPSPSAKPKSAKKKTNSKKESSSKSKKTAKSKAKKKQTPEPEETPAATKRRSPKPSETPVTRPTAPLPRAIPVATPSAPPPPTSTFSAGAPIEEPAQLTIEKSGYEKPAGFWSRVFGSGGGGRKSGAGYRYLTSSVRAEIDRAPADRRNPRWQMIVVHNSGTRQGNARAFDYYHRHVRHMRNGLAYHFVIGNGTSTGNGQIEVGDRWRRQINGGHVHSDYLNNIALGICLVGDFNRDQPTRAQLECCEELIRYLRQRCGKIGNHFPVVKPHREANPPRWGTDCPGDAFPYSWFRRFQE